MNTRAWIQAMLVIGCLLPTGPLAGAEKKTKDKAGHSTLLGLLPLGDLGEPERHILEVEKPAPPPGREIDRTVHSIYFPPNPPPLGVDLALGAIDARMGAPPDLAPYVMEPFYAPLSTRIIERSLTRKQEDALADYEARKSALLIELRARLRELAPLPPDHRRRALEALALSQTPAIAALETEADRLRVQFYSVPVSRASGSWYELRSWKLGRGKLEVPRGETLFLEYQLLRAAAFYQEGLSPPQRRLLRECSIELEAVVFPGFIGDAPQANDWFWFFSPHLARVHLPDDLPVDLQEAITTFRAEKEMLKAELRNAIYGHDRVVFGSSREPALKDLAQAQAGRIAALETQAEAIRRRIVVAAPQPAPPAPPDLPEELATQIDRYTAERTALERDLADRLRRAVRHLKVPDSYAPNPSLNAWREARLAAVSEARERFRTDQADRLAALRESLRAVRTAIETWAGPAAAGASVRVGDSSFLDHFFARRGEEQSRCDYHASVFEPGLAPEQRRLLLDAAIVAMGLPLPGPEEQPTSLPGTLLK